MSDTTGATPAARAGVARSTSSFLSRHVGTRLALVLSAPLGWLVMIYVVALAAMLVTAFWSVDTFTSAIERDWNLDNFRLIFENELYRTVTLRTVLIAGAVTIIDIMIALPIAFFMAKVASKRVRYALVIAVLTPLWASYLVKAFAWRAVMSNGGLMEWLGAPLGIESPGYGITTVIITQAYIWLPYVILPVFAGMERVPDSLLEAASDLGASNRKAVWHVMLPLLTPAIVAGSIFSFSLTMGDYITIQIVGGTSQMLGSLIYSTVGAGNNLPLASALSVVPIVFMAGYLAVARRLGALDNL